MAATFLVDPVVKSHRDQIEVAPTQTEREMGSRSGVCDCIRDRNLLGYRFPRQSGRDFGVRDHKDPFQSLGRVDNGRGQAWSVCTDHEATTDRSGDIVRVTFNGGRALQQVLAFEPEFKQVVSSDKTGNDRRGAGSHTPGQGNLATDPEGKPVGRVECFESLDQKVAAIQWYVKPITGNRERAGLFHFELQMKVECDRHHVVSGSKVGRGRRDLHKSMAFSHQANLSATASKLLSAGSFGSDHRSPIRFQGALRSSSTRKVRDKLPGPFCHDAAMPSSPAGSVLALSVTDLVKRYPSGTEALKGVSLEIADGEFFGLLGPNGAGKSTLIHCSTGLASPTSGSIEIFGHNAEGNYREAREAVGLAPQELNIDWFLTVEETLDFHGGYFGMNKKDRRERIDELLESFSLTEKRDERTRELSGGMKRRLILARALMHRPRLLILDEPTAGVDVELRLELWHYVKQANLEGTTILLTTHYLEEAEQLCSRIAFINGGEIVDQGSSAELAERFGVGSLEDAYLELVGRKELSRAHVGADPEAGQ